MTNKPETQDVREAYPITVKLIEAMRQVVPFGSSAQDDLLHHLEPIVIAALAQPDAQPRPDASGLIEAADYLIDRLQACLKDKPVRDLDEAEEAYKSARARAADRSAHGEAIPDCPTEGVAARQGNGG